MSWKNAHEISTFAPSAVFRFNVMTAEIGFGLGSPAARSCGAALAAYQLIRHAPRYSHPGHTHPGFGKKASACTPR